MSSTTNEAPYGQMAWGLNPSNPAANEAWRKRMKHAAKVMNRASDVFYAEAGHDLPLPYQSHPTHVQLAAAAVADQMAGQGLHPLHDSFAWAVYGSSQDEMRDLQNTLTSEEWQEVDDLARETLAQRMVAVLLHKALNNSDIPLADFIVEALEHTSSGELDELVKLATRTHRSEEVQS
ncbi:hypothetical protein [Synechococcus sp. UW105]|uniref:hypothetical protein n=1 Tax=Synechococcus sp. UW105 TaxID=337067 RepID=UPI000E0F63E9|nr:hypothetical protein [Synechococcus sp. UW105]